MTNGSHVRKRLPELKLGTLPEGHASKSQPRETGEGQVMEKLLTPQDLAEYLGVPLKTLYAWRYRNQGPTALRVGRHLRYRRSDVEQWIDRRRYP